MRGARRWWSLGLVGAFACLAFESASVGAQGMPPLPPSITTTGSCIYVAGSITCGGPAVSVPPVIVVIPGDNRGGPFREEGGHDVDVDVDISRSERAGHAVAR